MKMRKTLIASVVLALSLDVVAMLLPKPSAGSIWENHQIDLERRNQFNPEYQKYKQVQEENNARREQGLPEHELPQVNWDNISPNVDFATYEEYMMGLRNGDPNKFRQEKLRQADLRVERILAAAQSFEDKYMASWRERGLTWEEAQEEQRNNSYVKALSKNERFENYVAWKNNDSTAIPDRVYDSIMRDNQISEIQDVFGSKAADYARKQRTKTLKEASNK
ncbi:hypothetical protein ACLS0M_10635 [Avibacterium avium]|uniref:hypothetical protein n=1 Tax=Avibacterium avium TaxID=751 RepID=UPI003BF87175